jgi:acetyltransferase-like isoleucine patch superfamily enzyme
MDIRGYFCKYYYILSIIIKKEIFTIYIYLKAVLVGVKIGKGCGFFGNIRLYRPPGSIIVVGNNCTFKSISDSNLIGINHKSIISTQKKGAIIRIGNNCGFSGTVIGAFNEINIGNNVRCGANTVITDGDWHPDDPRTGQSKPIMLCDDVWLGLNVVVLKGVTIGKNSLIGANSVVTKDIPENVIAGGNPCRVLKTIKN